jgi:uncharacterized protein YoxC
MKIMTKRVASILLIAILALSFVTLPVHAVTIDALATPSGDKDDTIEVTGSDVQGGRTVNLYWDLVQDWSAADGAGLLNSSKAKSSGDWEVWFDVPESEYGDHYLYVEDSYTLDWDVTTFTVYSKISLSSSSGLATDEVDVDGYGFSGSSDVAIIFNDTTSYNTGTGDVNVIIPDGSETEFDDTLADKPVIPGTVIFDNVTYAIADDGEGGLDGLGALAGLVSGSINYVTGEWDIEFDFAPNKTGGSPNNWDVNWEYIEDDPNHVETLTTAPNTNDFGSFAREITIPSFPEGSYSITAMDEKGVMRAKDFDIGPVITLSPTSGPVGSVVQVDGRGFTASAYVKIATLNGIDCHLTLNSSVTSKNKFRIEFVVPSAGDADEEYELYVEDAGSKHATADFELTGKASITVNPTSAALGDEIEITGMNFSAIDEELVELWLYDDPVGLNPVAEIDVDDTETDTNGEFSGMYSVPPVQNGKYTIVATQPSLNIEDTTSFTVGLIFVVVKPTSGTCGEDVQISGVGFDDDSYWNATFGDIEVLPEQAVDTGLLTDGKFYVPTVDPGTYTIRVMGQTSGNYLDFDFEVTDTTTLEFDPAIIPVGEDESFNVTVEGEFWLYDNDVHLETIEMIMYNVTADGDIEEEWDLTTDLDNPLSDEDGVLDTWFMFYYTEDVSPGEYIINATQTGPNDEEAFAQTTITVVPESYSITPRKSTFAISDNVAFNIINSFKLDDAFMEIYDPNGDLYWITDLIDKDDWVKVGTAHQVPYYAQTSNANSLLLDPDAPVGEWFWVFYKGEDDELVNGTFNVGEAAEDILSRQLEELAGDLTQLSEDFAGISTDVSALATDVQALAGSVSDAIAAANAATSAVQQVASAVADVADVAAAAASAAEQAATAAASAQEAATDAGRSASGLTTLVYGAIGASLIAALAAIVSLMQISRRIAG